jgi:hypothetical protein
MAPHDREAEFRSRIASATAALLLALALALFVLGRGPGTLIWLNGSAPPWLPFAGTGLSWLAGTPLGWLPFVNDPGGDPTPVAAGQPSPSAHPSAGPTTQPANPTANPTSNPTAAPTANPTAKPSPTPTKVPSPTPTATLAPSPSPSPCPATSFSDTFEEDAIGPTASGWTLHTGNDSTTGGWYVYPDGTHVLKTTTTPFPVAHTGYSCWSDYTVSALVKTSPDSSNGLEPGHARVIARWSKPGYFYACGLDHSGTYESTPELFLGKEYGGTWYSFETTPYQFSATSWYQITFTVNGNNLSCTVTDPNNPSNTATVTTSQSYFSHGSIGATGEYAEFDNFQVSAIR